MKQARQAIRSLSLNVVLIICTICSASADTNKHLAPDLLQQMLNARIGCDRADDAMRAGLAKACDQFTQRCRRLGRFPDSEQELLPMRSELEQLVAVNPYTSNPALGKQVESQFPNPQAHFLITVDMTLNENSIRQMTDHPSKELSGTPGSMKIVHNAYDTFIVYGIGIDGKPVPNSCGKPLIMERHPFDSRVTLSSN